MGIDMAFDKQGHVWIIEVNFAPMLRIILETTNKLPAQIQIFHRAGKILD